MKIKLAAIGMRGFPGVQGGVEKHCNDILPHLGIPCRVYRRKPFVNKLDPAPENIEYVDLPSTRIKGFEAVLHTFLCVLHLLVKPVPVVNIHNIGPAFLSPILKWRGSKIVLTYHSTNYLHDKWGRIAKAVLRAGEKIGFRYSDKIIFVSESIRNSIKEQEILAKSLVIPNPVTKNKRVESTGFCRKIGVEAQKYILAVGRLSPEKGFESLIKAADSLPEGYRIVIAGTTDNNSDYLGYLKRLAPDNKVIFIGFADRETLAKLYSHAALFVLPSLFEGLSLALLEAMSYSLPVVVSDIEANRLPEIEDKAYFFNPGNVDELREAICNAISANAPVEYNLDRYSRDAVINATAAVYNSLLM